MILLHLSSPMERERGERESGREGGREGETDRQTEIYRQADRKTEVYRQTQRPMNRNTHTKRDTREREKYRKIETDNHGNQKDHLFTWNSYMLVYFTCYQLCPNANTSWNVSYKHVLPKYSQTLHTELQALHTDSHH